MNGPHRPRSPKAMAVAVMSAACLPRTRPKNRFSGLPLAAVRRRVILTALYGRPLGRGLWNMAVSRSQKPNTMSWVFSAGVIEVWLLAAQLTAADTAGPVLGSRAAAARAEASAERWSSFLASAM